MGWVAVPFLLLSVASLAIAEPVAVAESGQADDCLTPKLYAKLSTDDQHSIMAAVARRTRLSVVRIGPRPGQVADRPPPGVVDVAVLKKGGCEHGHVIGTGEVYWLKKRGMRWRIVKHIRDVMFAMVR
jgi:hypothetical protein